MNMINNFLGQMENSKIIEGQDVPRALFNHLVQKVMQLGVIKSDTSDIEKN